MQSVCEISPSQFGSKFWKRFSGYGFAATEAVTPVVLQELPQVLPHFVIAFTASSGGVSPVVLLTLQPGLNSFVSLDGRWLVRYVPAILRSYPFCVRPTADGRRVVCVDQDSGLIVEAPTQAEIFFEPDGTPGPALREVVTFLQAYEANRLQTATAATALQQMGLLEPWPLTTAGEDQGRAISGLMRVREAALAGLSGEQLVQLRDVGGLALAYGQLFSMGNLALVSELTVAQRRAREALKAQPQVNAKGELDLEFMNTSSTIDFSRIDLTK